MLLLSTQQSLEEETLVATSTLSVSYTLLTSNRCWQITAELGLRRCASTAPIGQSAAFKLFTATPSLFIAATPDLRLAPSAGLCTTPKTEQPAALLLQLAPTSTIPAASHDFATPT